MAIRRSRSVAFWEGAEAAVEKTVIAASEVFIGGEAGAEPTIKATTYRNAEAVLNAELQVTLAAMAEACTGTLAPLQVGFNALAASLKKFEAQASTFPTTRAKVC